MNKLARAASQARSWLVYTPLYAAATIGYGLVSMGWSRFDRTGRHQHRVAQAWARMLLRIARVRVTLEGAEHLIADRPAVMVCNHLSYMDTPVLFATLPFQFRILARKGLFRIPFLGGHLRRCQHLPVDQSNVRASMRSLYQAADSVALGLPLFVFPEAGRSFEGEMKEFVRGAFFIAVQAQVPVVPVVLVGTWELLPPGSAHLRGGEVEVIVGPPVPTLDLTRHDVEALTTQVQNGMREIYRARRGLLR